MVFGAFRVEKMAVITNIALRRLYIVLSILCSVGLVLKFCAFKEYVSGVDLKDEIVVSMWTEGVSALSMLRQAESRCLRQSALLA